MGNEPSGVVFSGFRWIAAFELWLPKLRREADVSARRIVSTLINDPDTCMTNHDRRNLRDEPEQRSVDEHGLARGAARTWFHARLN
jgi:hypothetical protein